MDNLNGKIAWLGKQIDIWVAEGIVDQQIADLIRQRYPAGKSSRSIAMIVFSAIGACVIGLGVILLFAYNWQDLSKYTKLAVIFGFLILSHSTGLVIYFRTERFKAVGESLTVLGTMLFGAGIWLIAQIYNIQEHFPNAFLFWGIGATLLAWTLPSISQAIIAAILFTIWAMAEGTSFGTPVPYIFPLLLSLFPLAYKKENSFLLTVLLVAISLSVIPVVAAYDDELILFSLLNLFVLYVVAGVNHRKWSDLDEFGQTYRFLGLIGYYITLFFLCFKEVFGELVENKPLFSNTESILCWSIFFIPSLVGFGLVIRDVYFKKETLKYYSHDMLLMPLQLIFYICYSVSISRYFEWPGMAVFNLIFLSHMLMMMAGGCSQLLAYKVVLGAIGLGALTFARFTDLFDSLLVRGVVFIVFGVIIFAQGFFYVSSKKKKVLQDKI